MDFAVKNLANFTLGAKGVLSKQFWLKRGKLDADAQKRADGREVKFTIQGGYLTAQMEEEGGAYVPFNNQFHYDPETLRNIAAVAIGIADAIDEEEADQKKKEA